MDMQAVDSHGAFAPSLTAGAGSVNSPTRKQFLQDNITLNPEMPLLRPTLDVDGERVTPIGKAEAAISAGRCNACKKLKIKII